MGHRSVECPHCGRSDTVPGPGTYECSGCHQRFTITHAMFAGSGAIIGFAVGGPIGAVVGGVIGYMFGDAFD